MRADYRDCAVYKTHAVPKVQAAAKKEEKVELNARVKHINDLSRRTAQLKTHTFIVQETLLALDRKFHLRHYRSFRVDRSTRGGVSLTLVLTRICHKTRESLKLLSPQFEILVIAFRLPLCPFFIANVYNILQGFTTHGRWIV